MAADTSSSSHGEKARAKNEETFIYTFFDFFHFITAFCWWMHYAIMYEKAFIMIVQEYKCQEKINNLPCECNSLPDVPSSVTTNL